MNVLVPLAEGFEEIEAVTIIDVLRRADIKVTSAYLQENPVTGSHDIIVIADTGIESVKHNKFDAVVLPGGMPGSENLKKNGTLLQIIKTVSSNGGLVAAICAAPIVLGHAGLLKGKKRHAFQALKMNSSERILFQSLLSWTETLSQAAPQEAQCSFLLRLSKD